MNKTTLITFTLLFSFISPAFGLPDFLWWKKDEQMDELNKPVPPKESNNSIETKNNKQHKPLKNQIKGNATSSITFEQVLKPLSPYILLRLPFDGIFNNKVIANGFYLVNDDKKYITLLQGNKIIAKLKAKQTKVDEFYDTKTIKVDTINNEIIKISIFLYNNVTISYLKINK